MKPAIRYMILSVASSAILLGFLFMARRLGADLSQPLRDLDNGWVTLAFVATMFLDLVVTLLVLLSSIRGESSKLKEELSRLIAASIKAAQQAGDVKPAGPPIRPSV